jgi:hypothetical protein
MPAEAHLISAIDTWPQSLAATGAAMKKAAAKTAEIRSVFIVIPRIFFARTRRWVPQKLSAKLCCARKEDACRAVPQQAFLFTGAVHPCGFGGGSQVMFNNGAF